MAAPAARFLIADDAYALCFRYATFCYAMLPPPPPADVDVVALMPRANIF